MTPPGAESEIRRLWGNLLLQLGLLFFGLLVASGLHSLTFYQPDMVHLNHFLSTAIGGPVVVGLVIGGLVLRRRS